MLRDDAIRLGLIKPTKEDINRMGLKVKPIKQKPSEKKKTK